MLRTASSLPPKGLLTLGSGPARFQTKPPACYRASWQLPGPDFHRQATTSLRTARSTTTTTSRCHLLLCWAHEITSVCPRTAPRMRSLVATGPRLGHPHAVPGEHLVECRRELAIPVADQEPEPPGPLAEI